MKTSHKCIDELLDLPHARLLLDQVQQQLEEEEQRRKMFHDNVKEDEKAEFINGKIIMHSPVRSKHWRISNNIDYLLSGYCRKHNLGDVEIEKVMIALSRNSYEPDICYFKKEKADLFEENQRIFPAPDLVVEILSDTTEKADRTIKFQDYQKHGIEEYWIVDAEKEIVEQYVLEDEEYLLQPKTEILRSMVVEGFSVPIVAFFDKKASYKAHQNF